MHDIVIRRATAHDTYEISDLICRTAEGVLKPHYSPRQWAVFLRYYTPSEVAAKIEGQAVFCAEIDGEIVGTVALDGQLVVGFYTRLENLRQGIGLRLMQHLEAYAKASGLEKIQLLASPVGLNFYYKNGWRKVNEGIFKYFGEPFEETLMEKTL